MDDACSRLIAELELEPHPEGGWFRRFHASMEMVASKGRLRPAMTAIHYLLAAGGRSEWHRVDADEVWHWQQGAVLEVAFHGTQLKGIELHPIHIYDEHQPAFAGPEEAQQILERIWAASARLP